MVCRNPQSLFLGTYLYFTPQLPLHRPFISLTYNHNNTRTSTSYIYIHINMIIPIKNIHQHIPITKLLHHYFITLKSIFFLKSKKMQATSLCSLVLPSTPRPGNLLRWNAPHKLLLNDVPTTRRSLIYASKRDSFGHQYDGKLVDENMILLRMRIHEIEMVEMKTKAPSDWTEWEKKYFENYGSDVCEAVGLLQRMLMNTRPSFAVGMLALVSLSMSISMLQLVFHLVELAKGIIWKPTFESILDHSKRSSINRKIHIEYTTFCQRAMD